MSQTIQAYVPQMGWHEIVPFAIPVLAGMLVLAIDALIQIFVKGLSNFQRDRILTGITIGSLLVTGFTFYTDMLRASGHAFLEGAFRADEFGNLGALVIIFGALVFAIMAPRAIERFKLPAGELYALFLFCVAGMVMLAVANELITAFICVEIVSLALYVLVGINRRSPRSGEAAFKYFLLGAFASAFLVLGTVFLFGATGTTQLFGHGGLRDLATEIKQAKNSSEVESLIIDRRNYDLGMNEVLLANVRPANVSTTFAQSSSQSGMHTAFGARTVAMPINPLWMFVGFSLVFVGLCFKLSLAPFHMWAPDVYEGAPTITTMFVATASKVAAFAFLVHLVEALSFWKHFPVASGFAISFVAAVSMIWGNIGALMQTNIKRMLAYSSVAHGGYMAVAIAAMVTEENFADGFALSQIRNALILYLFAYTIMNVIAFGIAAWLGKEGEGDIKNYRGLAKRRPGIAAGMAIAMLSLTGIPPTVGFAGKFMIFKEAIDSGLVGLAVIGMIMSAISAYYYLRIIVAMYMQDEEEGVPLADGVIETANGYKFAITLTTAMVFFFGLLPMLFLALGGTK